MDLDGVWCWGAPLAGKAPWLQLQSAQATAKMNVALWAPLVQQVPCTTAAAAAAMARQCRMACLIAGGEVSVVRICTAWRCGISKPTAAAVRQRHGGVLCCLWGRRVQGRQAALGPRHADSEGCAAIRPTASVVF